MKKARRLLLINWHGYVKALLSFGDVNFLTGKTGSGKSAIVDAMSLVMLADTRGDSYNKAASSSSVRTLDSYLYGYIANDEQGAKKTLRSGGDFSSYVVMEFFDDELSRYFTAGFAFDCQKGGERKTFSFLQRDKGLPENLYIKEGQPMSIAELKSFLKGYAGDNGWISPASNKRYRDELRVMLGLKDDRYLKLYRKAISFDPDSDVTRIVTEFLFDEEAKVDVVELRSNIDQYDALMVIKDRMENQIKVLHDIKERYRELETCRNQVRLCEYIIDRAGIDDMKENLQRSLAKMKELELSLGSVSADLEDSKKKRQDLEDERADLMLRLKTSDISRRLKEIEDNIKSLRQESSEITSQAAAWKVRLSRIAGHWIAIKDDDFALGAEEESPLRQAESGMEALPIEAFAAVTRTLWDRLSRLRSGLEKDREEMARKIKESRRRLEKLEADIMPYPAGLERFIEEFQTRSGVRPEVFADLVDLSPECGDWRLAIESYLGKDRLTVFVPEELRDDALMSAQDYDDLRIYIASAQDTAESFLSRALITRNADARAFADLLLGPVFPGETDEGPWVKPDGTFCRNGEVIREIAQDYCLGREARKLMAGKERERLQSFLASSQKIDARLEALSSITPSDMLQVENEDEIKKAIQNLKRLPMLAKAIREAEKERDSLDLGYLMRLEEEIKRVGASIVRCSSRIEELSSESGRLSSEIGNMKNYIPQQETRIKEAEHRLAESYEPSWVAAAEDKYEEARQAERQMSLKDSYQRQLSRLSNQKDNLSRKLMEVRISYNNRYGTGLDTQALDNDAYDSVLAELEAKDLPRQKENLEKARSEAYRVFRNSFILEIRGRISDVEKYVRDLNYTLKGFEFGTDRFSFVVRANQTYRRFYDMFMDNRVGKDDSEDLFVTDYAEVYENEIRLLFDLLFWKEEGKTAKEAREHEDLLQLYTDYRTYLSFDIKVTNKAGDEDYLSKSYRAKSGGETQLPFYIALLASFAQACRIKSKSNNTIRLIVFDEAFSKMDGERIQESIRLLKDFGFQALLAAPPDKAEYIVPLVDKANVVLKEDNLSYLKEFSLNG